ncbi:MAG: DUF2935 domain-containing protein [Candidatus Babeliales bacterium]|nr:DUF2935 domain-containing protein [Candidatus Babeliales bacterium]
MKKLLFIALLSIVPALNYASQSELSKEISSGEISPTNNKLFKRTNNNLNTLIDETNFWSKQMEEHALFLYLGLTDVHLKNQAHKLHKKIVKFRRHFKHNKTLPEINAILPLLKQERNLQVAAINKSKKQWIGWLYPSLIKHMTLELDYFVDKLNGVIYSPEKETEFWEKEASDRIGTIAHLLDPSEKALVKEANQISEQYFDVPKEHKEAFLESALTAIQQVNTYSKKLDAKKANVESIISDTLANHEAREGKRGEAILSALKAG